MKTNVWKSGWFVAVLYGLSGAAAALPCSSLGATTNISVVNFAFSPPSVTINVNDQVVWTWVSTGLTAHTTTSDTNGLWDSGSHTLPFSFPLTFTNAGVYPYHCTPHVLTFNMKGTVTVQAANAAPSVAVTNPADGTVFSAPASFSLSATASDTDGTVTNVQFFQGVSSLGNVPTRPYSVPINNLAAGNYVFSAVASDNGGLKATNAINVHAVTPVPVVLSGVQRPSASSFQFNYSANVGLKYVVLRSGALPAFAPINTNTATSNPMPFLDNGASGQRSFYRVQLQPNP